MQYCLSWVHRSPGKWGFATGVGDFLYYVLISVAIPSSCRPHADGGAVLIFASDARFAAQKERTKSGYFRLNPSRSDLRKRQKKTRYPEIASLWSGCGGRTRTCDLRVMSPTSCQLLYSAISGAGDRGRTGTGLLPRDFKSLASANSATPASGWRGHLNGLVILTQAQAPVNP